MLVAQGPAQARATTAPVQRRKSILERSRFGADHIGHGNYIFVFHGRKEKVDVAVAKLEEKRVWLATFFKIPMADVEP